MEPAARPLVSAVIPAFDAAAYVAQAVESVLSQSHDDVECIVVDDGSTDATADVLAAFGARVAVLRQPRSGIAVARNHGASQARGDLLAFLDADDRWCPTRVERGIQVMRETEVEAVLCASRVIGRRGPMGSFVRLQPPKPSLESLLLWRGTVVSPASNMLITRRAFDAMGGFHRALSTTADWEFLVQLVARGRMTYIDEPLVEYRWHGRNITRNLDETERDLRRAYEIVLAREGHRISISARRAYGGFHRMLAAANLRLGRPAVGLSHAARAVWRDPSAVVDVVTSRIARRS